MEEVIDNVTYKLNRTKTLRARGERREGVGRPKKRASVFPLIAPRTVDPVGDSCGRKKCDRYEECDTSTEVLGEVQYLFKRWARGGCGVWRGKGGGDGAAAPRCCPNVNFHDEAICRTWIDAITSPPHFSKPIRGGGGRATPAVA
ncbi:unnamed protein product, partial [Iphiclides podalirius]